MIVDDSGEREKKAETKTENNESETFELYSLDEQPRWYELIAK